MSKILHLDWHPEGTGLHARADGLVISAIPLRGGEAWMGMLCDEDDLTLPGGLRLSGLDVQLAEDYPDTFAAQVAAERLYRRVRGWLGKGESDAE